MRASNSSKVSSVIIVEASWPMKASGTGGGGFESAFKMRGFFLPGMLSPSSRA
jgi:hypothetical protein